MHVKLISLTQGAIPMANLNPSNTVRTIAEPLSPEELIAYTARVSNPANQMNLETTDRLLGFLIRNKHWSPFEMVSMTLEIKTSRGIAPFLSRNSPFATLKLLRENSTKPDARIPRIAKIPSTT